MTELVIIGGSAGSFRPVCNIIKNLKPDLNFPVVLVLHRLKNINEGFEEILNINDPFKSVIEPCDKEVISKNKIYLAPANYHLLFNSKTIFSLSNDEPYIYSRPSIDLSFISASICYKQNILGIILSGANKDGANGLYTIFKHGGSALIQNIDESEIKTMPLEASKIINSPCFLSSKKIADYINSIA